MIVHLNKWPVYRFIKPNVTKKLFAICQNLSVNFNSFSFIFKMSQFVIEEQSVDSLKENYNKVIFQKQMLVAQSDKKRMESPTKTIER